MLSVLLGTFNRFPHLQRCLTACRASYGGGDLEFVICDGGSTDGSREWLAAQQDVILIGERKLEGACKAINQCFALSRGEYVTILNDDIAPIERALDAAIERLADPTIGQVACPFRQIDEARPFHIEHVNGLPYANIAVMRRPLLETIVGICGGVWNPRYRTYGGDTELSCWVHRLGYKVVEEPKACFVDYMPQDELRNENHKEQRGVADNQLFWSRWRSPEMLVPFGPLPTVKVAERIALVRYEDRRR